MNKTEKYKYDNLKKELDILKIELQDANKKILYLEHKVLDLLVLLFSGNKHLRLIHIYIKQKYPDIFELDRIKNRGDYIMEQIANIKNGFSFRSESKEDTR